MTSTLALATLAAAVPARADDEKAVCVAAAEEAQKARDERSFSKEREQLLLCVRDVCPALVRKDCVDWLAKLDENQPSVVVIARNADGQDVTAVRVACDGAPVASSLDGSAVRLDPGPHTLRFEMGSLGVGQSVVIRVGEKNREIVVTFPREPPAPSPSAPLPVGPIVLGSIGVAAVVAFAILGGTGTSQLSTLHSTCGVNHMCTQGQVDGVRETLVAGDISLLAGVVSIGTAATWFFLSHHKSPSAAAARSGLEVGFVLGPQGFGSTLGAAF